MNWRVGMSLVMAAVWLGVAIYFLAQPEVQFAFGKSHLIGWLAVLFLLWNILRAGLAWSRPKRSHERPF